MPVGGLESILTFYLFLCFVVCLLVYLLVCFIDDYVQIIFMSFLGSHILTNRLNKPAKNKPDFTELASANPLPQTARDSLMEAN